jgi:hypothetical protein
MARFETEPDTSGAAGPEVSGSGLGHAAISARQAGA